MGRVIRFMAPDLPTPSGGIKVIYRYVEHLCALGYDARVRVGRGRRVGAELVDSASG